MLNVVNNKSLFAFVCDLMEKLDNKAISTDDAKAQASLAKQANNALSYELKRADVQMRLTAHNAIYKDGLRLREIESKNFDSTID